jgi:predicted nucleotidyltransferase
MAALEALPDLSPVFGTKRKDFLQRAVDVLVKQLPVEEIWLFGSCARGEARPDSDIDLLVVLSENHGIRKPTAECFRILFGLKNVIAPDVMAISRSQWDYERAHPFGAYGEAAKEGLLIYAK